MSIFTSKKTLRKRIKDLEETLAIEINIKNTALKYNEELADKVEELLATYPFVMGQVVYDVQLRSATGRFTKTKPSREHSIINEVIVDKKNYFNLVERYNSNDVFTDLKHAEEYLDAVCVD